MSKTIDSKELAFSITARTVILLGRENISSPTVAVLELVKNAYDADATNVTVRFRNASGPNGTIEIIDNGHGMNWEDIITKWMVIGTNNKLISPISPNGRRKVGEKGIGRFALDRLASETILETTFKEQSTEPTYRLSINWDRFSKSSKDLHEIKHPIKVLERRNRCPGTRLRLKKLRDTWTKQDYERLYQNLIVLIPPFEKKLVGFSIIFDCDEAPELSGNIRNPLIEAALFKMKCDLDKSGNVKINITTRENSTDGKFKLFAKHDKKWNELFDSPEIPSCGPLHFEFYFYLRESITVQGLDIKLRQLKDYLDVYGGVRIYRDGFRIKPYGDPRGEGDWLGLNWRRVKHPGGAGSDEKWVVGENQVAAGVFVSNETNPELKDQTNREGLISNRAYNDLRAFVLKCIEYFETDRQDYERRKQSKKEPVSVDQSISDAKQRLSREFKKLEEAIDSQPEGSEKDFLKETLQQMRDVQSTSLNKVQSLYETEQESTMSKMQLLQNAATIGIAVAALGHEVLQSGRHVLDSIERLGKRLRNLMLINDEKINEYLSRLNRHGIILYSVASFALGHIDRDKRTKQEFNVDDCIQRLVDENLKEICATNNAQLDFIRGNVPHIYAFPYEIESIVTNFVTNSIAAFQRGRTRMAERQIEIETSYDQNLRALKIVARDNGPGIAKDDKDRIFDIYSTKVDEEGKPYGTGLGLVIVKDIVESYKGSVVVHEHSSKETMRGAEFIVTFPVPKERGPKKGDEND
jgi:hypothetical protein